MKHWLFYLGFPNPSADGSPRDIYETILCELDLADTLGYTGAWFAEHHSTPNYATIPNPLLFTAVAAQRTKRLRLGPACIVLPLHNPVRVAEDIAMVDALSNGRLEVSLCRGSHPFEYRRLGHDYATSEDDFHQGLRLVIQYLNGTHADVIGPSHPPPTTQTPHPPLWSSSGSRSSIQFALDNGLHVMAASIGSGKQGIRDLRTVFERECRARGIDPASQRFAILVQSAVTRTESDIRRAVDFAKLLHVIAVRRLSASGLDSLVDDHDMAFDMPREGILEANLIGDASHIRDQLDFYEDLGITDVIIQPSRLGKSVERIREDLVEYSEVAGIQPSVLLPEAKGRSRK